MKLDAPVPAPGPSGPYGTMAWLRATVSRFANGETHARRRALAESLLAELDPAELRDEAARMARGAAPPAGAVETPYLPVAVLARRLGARDLGATVAATRVVAAAYQPHT